MRRNRKLRLLRSGSFWSNALSWSILSASSSYGLELYTILTWSHIFWTRSIKSLLTTFVHPYVPLSRAMLVAIFLTRLDSNSVLVVHCWWLPSLVFWRWPMDYSIRVIGRFYSYGSSYNLELRVPTLFFTCPTHPSFQLYSLQPHLVSLTLPLCSAQL